MKHEKYTEQNLNTAEELWEALNPIKDIFPGTSQPIYRGQANSEWGLIPSVLRIPNLYPFNVEMETTVKHHKQRFMEMRLLQEFVRFCDQIGLRIPNDSIEFRKHSIDSQIRQDLNKISQFWPSDDLHEVLALAQHHGVPTRLLDWSKQPYVSTYFAASSALFRKNEWKPGEKLAVWILNLSSINSYPSVKILKVPGSITQHLSAQSGLFTLHPHSETVQGQVHGLEHQFSSLPDSPLKKLTLPVEESSNLLKLCEKAGFTGATIYRSADGAGLAVRDSMNIWEFDSKEKTSSS